MSTDENGNRTMVQKVSNDAHDNRTKSQRSTPASLLKQLRATAAVMCYDHLFGQPTMPASEFQRKLYNMYHGNEDLNIVSQIELMFNAKGRYSQMYQTVHTLNTLKDVEISKEANAPITNQLALSPVLLNFDFHIRYVSGEHFTVPMLQCPTKTVTKELCTGRFLLDLSKQTVANIKKASILADQWLVDNETPSGTVWEDLYRYLIENSDKINAREKVFTGMAAFICCSKYNDGGENHLNVLAKNDDDAVAGTDSSRSKSRLSVKSEKDKMRSIETGDNSLFNNRGLTLDSKMQMVEIAQFEDAQARDDIKNDIMLLTNRNKLLLVEREQEINLAKLICPQYDENNENWKRVMALSQEISLLKKEMVVLQNKKSKAQSKQFGKSMAAKFLASVCGDDDVEVFGSDAKKRSLDAVTHDSAAGSSAESPMKKTITIDEDENSCTSSINTGQKSKSDRESCVSDNNRK